MVRIYNTLSRSLEEFEPVVAGKVGIYTCGPTVYRDVHIGNFRTYLTTDILVRLFKYKEYDVKSVMNITDVGHFRYSAEKNKVIDPVIEEANLLGVTPLELSRRYTEKFISDSKKLNILPPDNLPKASEHIDEMIEVIQVLIDKGYAYESRSAGSTSSPRASSGQADGNIYFSVEKFKDYGKLSGNTLDKAEALLEAVRVSRETDKKDSADFALWKSQEDRIMSFKSPWGQGVPGWHIECSVMSMKYLGITFDIHLGGEDLIFPHHEDEIAQSEAFSGRKFSNYFMHTSYLLVDEEKMSRSKNNIYTLNDLNNRDFSAMDFKYLTYQTHYRSYMNFTWDALKSSRTAYLKLLDFMSKIPNSGEISDKYEAKFMDAVEKDLNMPKALAVLWELIRSSEPESKKYGTIKLFDGILGLKIIENSKKIIDVPDEVKQMAVDRDKLRAKKKYLLADQIRYKIEKKGYIVEDMEKGSRVLKRI